MQPNRIFFNLPSSSELGSSTSRMTTNTRKSVPADEQSEQLPKGVFYSRSIIHDQSMSEMSCDAIVSYPKYAWQTKTEGCYPQFATAEFALQNEYTLESAQKWITYPGAVKVRFPLQTIQPKVQMIRRVPRKQLPRDVEVDRRRRRYAKFNIEEMLRDAQIEPWKLLPVERYGELYQQYHSPSHSSNFERNCFISLEMFDNQDFDCYSPEGWLSLGYVEGKRHPLPALAFLPRYEDDVESASRREGDFDQIRNSIYSWRMVAVYDHDSDDDMWIVTDLEAGEIHRIARIYLMFIAESPFDFLHRLEHALEQREISENIIKFQFVIDCLLMTNIPNVEITKLDRIEAIAKANLHRLHVGEEFEQDLRTEIQLSFQRIMAMYEFEAYLKMFPDEFPFLKGIHDQLDNWQPYPMREGYNKPIRMEKLKHILRRATLYYVNASFDAMCKVAVECSNIEAMHLFQIAFTKVVPLNDFVSTQQYNCSNVVKYLKGFWVETMSAQICICLRGVGKGWLDLSMSDWGVYLVAKMFRFLLQVKFRMQDSLQCFLEKAILNYSRLLNDPCEDFLHLNEDFEWTEDFKTNPFPKTTHPVFYLVLSLSATTAFYSTDPKEFEPAVQKVFYECLMQTCGIRVIDRDVMTNLNFARNLYLLSVEMIEDLYVIHRDLLKISYQKAVYPLNAYALMYHRFVPFYRTSVNDFIKEFAEAKKTSQEVKEEILLQKRLKQELRDILPSYIIIGPFYINTDPLKQHLISKRIEMIKRLFEYYVDRMYAVTEDLLDQFHTINGRLTEKAISIEHLYKIKDYILTVPEMLDVLRERVQIMMLEYDVLDFFWYNLNDIQFGMKWEAFGWPHKISMRLITIKEEHKNEIEEFKRMQISEVTGFEERLESLNEEIMTYSLQFKAKKALEVAVEAKKTWKTIQEMQKLGEILQRRQIIFELEELSLEFLDSIITSFSPYRNLWTACSDFLKLEEATIGNPMTNVELDDVKLHLEELQRILQDSVEVFQEKVEIQAVANYYLQKIDEFRPVVEIIECLKNPHWLILHWQELALKSGVEIKYTVSINFLYCMKKGILENIELVKDIARRAVEEADAIQRALEEEERLKREASLARLERKKQRKCRTDIM